MKRCSIKIRDLITKIHIDTTGIGKVFLDEELCDKYILRKLSENGIDLQQPIRIWFDVKNDTMNYENIQTKEGNHEDER